MAVRIRQRALGLSVGFTISGCLVQPDLDSRATEVLQGLDVTEQSELGTDDGAQNHYNEGVHEQRQ